MRRAKGSWPLRPSAQRDRPLACASSGNDTSRQADTITHGDHGDHACYATSIRLSIAPNDPRALTPRLGSYRSSAGVSLNAFGHQGLHHDEATGLIYNRARMLHPVLGRFVQRDPLGYVDGMSRYQYVRSRPLRWVDPSGSQAAVPEIYQPGPTYSGTDVSVDSRLRPGGTGSGVRANRPVGNSREGQAASRQSLSDQINGAPGGPSRIGPSPNPLALGQPIGDDLISRTPIVGDYYGTGYYSNTYLDEGAAAVTAAGTNIFLCNALNISDLSGVFGSNRSGTYNASGNEYKWTIQKRGGKCYFVAFHEEVRIQTRRRYLLPFGEPYIYRYRVAVDDIVLGSCLATNRCAGSNCK